MKPLLTIPLIFSPTILALGINCQGSAICPIASLFNLDSISIVTALRDEIYNSSLPLSTSYGEHEHITCVGNTVSISIGPNSFHLSSTISAGAVCAFPENVGDERLTLEEIRVLADNLVARGCTTCGGVPISFLQGREGDVADGMLKFDFVGDETCTGNCIMRGRNEGNGSIGVSTSSAGSMGSMFTSFSTPLLSTTQSVSTSESVSTTEAPSTTSTLQTPEPTTSTIGSLTIDTFPGSTPITPSIVIPEPTNMGASSSIDSQASWGGVFALLTCLLPVLLIR